MMKDSTRNWGYQMLRLIYVAALTSASLWIGAAIAEPTGFNGGVVALKLPESAIQASFRENSLLIVHKTAIVALPLDLEPGSYEIMVKFQDGNEQPLNFFVQAKTYDEEHIQIDDEEKVTPPPEFYERLAKESELMKQAYATRSPSVPDLLPLVIPVEGRRSGVFGTKRFFNGEARNPHSGVDYAAITGTPIQAPAPGTIILAEEDMFFNGKTVVIDHGMGFISVMCHLNRIDVQVEESIQRGDQLGTVGETGRSTGPHLHWTISLQGVKVDPEVFMAVVNDIHQSIDDH